MFLISVIINTGYNNGILQMYKISWLLSGSTNNTCKSLSTFDTNYTTICYFSCFNYFNRNCTQIGYFRLDNVNMHNIPPLSSAYLCTCQQFGA